MYKHLLFAVLLLCSNCIYGADKLSFEKCQQLARTGDVEAVWQLGCRYENGDGVRKNTVKALTYYKRAAEKKHKKACAKMAAFYEKGLYVNKDIALAAKYRAWAQGDDGLVEIAKAETEIELNQIDKIELALNYILGCNGAEMNVSKGIRILYEAGKSDPAARKVFVKRWENGDLDGALMELSDEEWDLLIPWFREAYDSGHKYVGQILGYEAYSKCRYREAARYWKAAGNVGSVKSLVWLAKLYQEGRSLQDGGGLKSMQSDKMAKEALEKAVEINPNHEEAAFLLAYICMYSKNDKCIDYGRARDIFKVFYENNPNDKWNCWNYGYAGLMKVCSVSIENMRQAKRDLDYHSYAPSVREQKYRRYVEQREKCINAAATWIPVIRRAAELDCEPAILFLQDWDR